jgi:hypothetical protein
MESSLQQSDFQTAWKITIRKSTLGRLMKKCQLATLTMQRLFGLASTQRYVAHFISNEPWSL